MHSSAPKVQSFIDVLLGIVGVFALVALSGAQGRRQAPTEKGAPWAIFIIDVKSLDANVRLQDLFRYRDGRTSPIAAIRRGRGQYRLIGVFQGAAASERRSVVEVPLNDPEEWFRHFAIESIRVWGDRASKKGQSVVVAPADFQVGLTQAIKDTSTIRVDFVEQRGL